MSLQPRIGEMMWREPWDSLVTLLVRNDAVGDDEQCGIQAKDFFFFFTYNLSVFLFGNFCHKP